MPATVRLPLPGGHFTTIDAADMAVLADMAIRYSSGYAKAYDKARRNSIGVHRILVGDRPGMVVDHINGDPLDNRRSNLRHVTLSENRRNSRPIGGASRFKGVSFHSTAGKWRATIGVNRKVTFVGCFETEEAAARAYDREARRLHGACAKTNEDMGLFDAPPTARQHDLP